MRKSAFILFFFLLCHIKSYSQDIYSWFKIDLGVTENLNFLTFRFAQEFIVGDNGLILRSSDQGASWVRIKSPVNENLNCITGGGPVMIICGDNGTILRSSDWGLSWQKITYSDTTDLNFTSSIAYQRYWIVGDNGTIIKSLDTAKTWQRQSINTSNNLNFITNSFSHKYITGDNGTYIEGPGLDSLSLTNPFTSEDINWLSGTAVGSNGLISYLYNNWVIIPPVTSEDLNSTDGIFICGNNGTILKEKIPALYPKYFLKEGFPVSTNLNCITAENYNIAWVVGDSGAFYKRQIDHNKLYNHRINGNNITSWISNDLTFNRYPANLFLPGFYWPDSIKFAIYRSGLSITAKINNKIYMSSAFHKGDFEPGVWGNADDTTFRVYKITKDIQNYDYNNWGRMVPYGAPYEDINKNGSYEAGIDIPGIKDAAQTLFIQLKDVDDNRNSNTAFGSSYVPLKCDVQFTVWSYSNNDILNDVLFYKAVIINRSSSNWTNSRISILVDNELGYIYDDFSGSDSALRLAYSYNSDNFDDNNGYGLNPPSVGTQILKPLDINNNSCITFYNSNNHSVRCLTRNYDTTDYNFVLGLKQEAYPLISPITNLPTRFNYTGDPETGLGWTEFTGSYKECDNDPLNLTSNYSSDHSIALSTGNDSIQVLPDSSITIVFSQLIKRGSNHLNSVTKLKEAAAYMQQFYDSLEVINNQEVIPTAYELFQNFPNPFNPVTTIKFSLPEASNVKLTIYDVSGRKITSLINNEFHQAGTFEKQWNAVKSPSGVYFYQLEAKDRKLIKKMVLIK